MSDNNAYSSDKALKHLDRLLVLQNSGQPYPAHVQIVISDYCNQNCNFCFPAGTLVLTETGYVDIKDIEISQRVFDEIGNLQNVNNVFSRSYSGLIINFKFLNDITSLKCTPEHPIWIRGKGYTPASDIMVDDNVQFYSSEENEFIYLKIVSKSEENYDGVVYNISVDNTESYIANNIVVHNCAYRMDGYSSNKLFKVIENGNTNNNPKRMIPWQKLQELVEDFSAMGVKASQLSVWANERIPLISPEGRICSESIGKFVDQFFDGGVTEIAQDISVAGKGWKSIAINDDGKAIYGTITHVYRHKAIEDLVEVILEDGRRIIVTESHSINVIRNNRICKIPVKNITTDDYIACLNWNYSSPQFPASLQIPPAKAKAAPVPEKIATDEDLFKILGYHTAEGTMNSRSVQWNFGTGPMEDFYRKDVTDCIKRIFNLKTKLTCKTKLRLDSVRVQSLFIELGMGGIANTKTIPQIVWGAPSNLKLAYLYGLYGGDGNFRSNIYKKKYKRNSLHLKTSSRELAQEVGALLRQLDCRCSITEGRNKIRMIEGRKLLESDYYVVNVSDKKSLLNVEKIVKNRGGSLSYVESIYSISGQKLKKPAAPFGKDAYALKIKLIRKRSDIGRPIVYDITVENTHRFITSCGIGCFNTGGGEPTVHPYFYEFAKLILDKKINLALVTNGLLLNQKRAELLTQAAWIRVSVDCATPESYSKIRDVPPEEFNIVARNITRLASMKRSVILGTGFVITNQNYKELYDGCRLFKEWGADNVRISALFQNDGASYFKEIYADIQEQLNLCKSLNDKNFTVFDNFGSRYEDLELGNPDYSFCPYMNLTTYIGGDQNVYTCCVNSYNEKGLIGSIKDQSFKTLWDSSAKKGFFNNFDASKCNRCMFNEKNRFINKVLSKKTVHDDFI